MGRANLLYNPALLRDNASDRTTFSVSPPLPFPAPSLGSEMSAAVGSFTAVVPQPATRRRVARAARCSVAGGVAAARPILKNLQLKCATPLPVLRHVADAMAADMRAGLAADGASDLKMILSYVDSLPSGYG